MRSDSRRLLYDLRATTVPLILSMAWYSVDALPLYSCLSSMKSDKHLQGWGSGLNMKPRL